MSAKEVMQMNYLFDSTPNRILGCREVMAAPEIADKSAAHLNSLFARYIQKYGQVADYLLIATLCCNKSKAIYSSLFSSNELQDLEQLASQGGVIEIGYFAVYDKSKYSTKEDVLAAYEKHNFEVLLKDTQNGAPIKEKETQKIKKVWLNPKDKVDAKPNSQISSQESNFYKNNKTPSIANFFKKPA